MTKPTALCCATHGSYCSRIDTLVDSDDVHVIAVARSSGQVTLTIETLRERQGCRRCGVEGPGESLEPEPGIEPTPSLEHERGVRLK